MHPLITLFHGLNQELPKNVADLVVPEEGEEDVGHSGALPLVFGERNGFYDPRVGACVAEKSG